jgi:hypothetical protein
MRLLRFLVADSPRAVLGCAPATEAFVCLPHGDRFPRHWPRILRQARATLFNITTRLSPVASAQLTLDSAPN